MNGSIDKTLLILKRKPSREGVFGVLRQRKKHIKPGGRRRARWQRAELIRQRSQPRDARARSVSQ